MYSLNFTAFSRYNSQSMDIRPKNVPITTVACMVYNTWSTIWYGLQYGLQYIFEKGKHIAFRKYYQVNIHNMDHCCWFLL